jgi:hypothetical protein
MARKRKTEAERRQEREDAKRRAADVFFPRLQQVATFREAMALALQAPAPDTPGRTHHTSLLFFLESFRPPMGASYAENAEYVVLARRLAAGGEITPETLAQIEHDFAARMQQQGPYG